MHELGQFAANPQGFRLAMGIGYPLPRNVERRPMIDRGTDDRQS